MALGKETLEIKITAEAKQAQSAIEQITGKLANLKSETDKSLKGAGDGVKPSVDTSEAQKAVGIFGNLREVINNLFIPVTALNQAFELTGMVLGKLSVAINEVLGNAILLEKQIAEVKTLLTEEEVAAVNAGRAIIDLQTEFGKTQNEVAKALKRTLATGVVDAAQSMDFMRLSMKLAAGGMTSLTNSTNVLTSVMASYGMEMPQLVHATDALFIAARDSKAEIDDFAQQLGDALGIANQLGVSFDELVSYIAAVTLSGIPMAEAVTTTNAAMVALMRQTEDMTDTLQDYYKTIGVSGLQAAIEQEGLVKVLRDIVSQGGQTSEALIALFGRYEALKGVTAITGGNIGKEFDKIRKNISEASKNIGGDVERAFGLIADTTAFKLNLVKERSRAIMTEIGLVFSGSMNSIAGGIASSLDFILQKFRQIKDAFSAIKFDEAISKSASATWVFVAAIDALAIAFIAINWQAISAGTLTFAANFPKLITTVKLLAASIAGIAVMSGKILAVAGAILAVAASVDFLVRNIDKLGSMVTIIFDSIHRAVLILKQLFFTMFDTDESKRQVDQIDEQINWLEHNIGKLAAEMDTGFAGDMYDQVAKFFSAFKDGAQAAEGPVTGLGKATKNLSVLPPDEETIRRYKAIIDLANGLRDELERLTKPPEEAVKAIAERNLAELNTVRERLRTEGRLGRKRSTELAKAESIIQKRLAADLKKLQDEKAIAATEAQSKIVSMTGSELDKTVDLYVANSMELSRLQSEGLISYEAYLKAKEKLDIKYLKDAQEARRRDEDIANEDRDKRLKAVTSAVQATQSGIGGILSAIGSATGPIGTLVTTIVGAMNKSTEEMDKMVHQLIQDANNLPIKVLNNIPVVIAAIVDELPRSLVSAFASVQTLLKVIFGKQFWMKILEGLKYALWDIMFQYKDLMDQLLNGEDIAKQLSDQVRKGMSFEKAFSGISEEIFTVLDAAAGKRGSDASDRMAKAIQDSTNFSVKRLKEAWKWVVSQLTSAWEVLKETFEFIGMNFLNPFSATTQAVFAQIALGVFDPFLMGTALLWDKIFLKLTGAGEALKAVWQVVYDTMLQPFVSGIESTWKLVKDTVWTPIEESFYAIGDFFAKVFDDPVAALEGLINDIATVFEDATLKAKQWLIDSTQQMLDWGRSIFLGFKNAVIEVGDWFAKIGDQIGAGFSKVFNKDTIKEAWNSVTEWFSSLGKAETWKSFGDSIAEAVRKAFDIDWESIGRKIEDLVSRFGNFLKKLFEFDGGGKKEVENFLGMDFPFVAFAKGGVVPGYAPMPGDSSRNDRIPAMLSPGEIVVPRSVLDSNKELRNVLIDAISGRDITFAKGGLLEAVKKKLKPPKPKDMLPVLVGLPPATPLPPPIEKAAEKVVEVVIPPHIMSMFVSIMRFIPSISLMDMVKDPKGTLEKAIKSSGAFDPFIKQVLKKPQGFANGGPVDSVPAMLTPGEFVMSRAAVDRLGVPFLNRLNSGGDSDTTVNVTLNITTEQPIDERFIRSKIVPTIKDEFRRASLDGRRILSPAGVR